MKITFISTILGFPLGGADTMWTRAAEAAAERGDELLISVSPQVAADRRIAALRARGAHVHECSAPTLPSTLKERVTRKVRRFLQPADSLVVALAAFRPDLVVISLGGTYDLLLHSAWIDWLAASGTKYRLIANWQQENPFLPDAERERAARALTLADQVNFVSTRNLEVTRRHLLTALPRGRVLQNPLRWTPGNVAPWPASAPLQLATVSRLDESKGIPLLLHTLAARPPSDDWRLNIYGHGPAESYLHATIEHLRLSPRVALRGHVGSLRDIWAENHLLISPSLDDGVPMTIPEAMLCVRPVLATAVGGAEDWLRDGDTGFICPAPTLPLLAEALCRALAARERWPEMGRRASHAAAERYRPDDYRRLLE